MYECPKCHRNVYCSRHVCTPDLPDSADLAASMLGNGIQIPGNDPRADPNNRQNP